MAGSGLPGPKHVSLATLQSLNGLFAIYKKRGPTSADVLNSLKEALLKEAGVQNPNPRKRKKQALKIGHGGTLDSAASGVLVVGIGNGTKMLSTMLAGSKKYRAVGELGTATDTLDATGSVVHEKSYDHITKEDFEEKLKTFTGDIMQVPPLYSALKKDGQRLSVLLKRGQEVEAKPARPVTVYQLALLDFTPPLFTLDIECGGGFYVRSLVDELGKVLSSCAHVKQLVRTKQGQFTLDDHTLRQDHWTVQHILQSLQPCPGSEVTQPCPGSEVNQPCLGSEVTQPCPGSEVTQPCPGSEVTQPCPGSEVNQPCPGSEVAQPCPGSEVTQPCPGSEVAQPCPGSEVNQQNGKRASGTQEAGDEVEDEVGKEEKSDS